MSQGGDWRSRWAAALRRAATAPHAPVIAGVLLAVLAAAQAFAMLASTSAISTGDLQVAFVLLAIATALPLGLLWAYPAAAAVAVCAACVLSLWAFHALPVAGMIALLVLEYRLGWRGSQLLAALLAAPAEPVFQYQQGDQARHGQHVKGPDGQHTRRADGHRCRRRVRP